MMSICTKEDDLKIESKGSVFAIEVKKADFDAGTFEGLASKFGNVDGHGDIVEAGAFGKIDVKKIRMLAYHDPNRPIGTWTSIKATKRGLEVKGKFTKGVKDADEMLALLKDGAIDGLSIGFRTVEADPRRDKEGNYIGQTLKKVDLWEISLVTFPSNPDTRTSKVKEVKLRDLEKAMRDAGLSRSEARKVLAYGHKALTQDAKAKSTPQSDLRVILASMQEANSKALASLKNTVDQLATITLNNSMELQKNDSHTD